VSFFHLRHQIPLFVLLLAGCAATCAQVVPAQENMRRARDLIVAGKPESALGILYPLRDSLAGSSRRDLYFSCGNMIVNGLAQRGELARAESLALALESGIIREFGAADTLLADTYAYLGYRRGAQFRFEEAEAYCRKGIALRVQLHMPLDNHIASMEFVLGAVLSKKGDFRAAVGEYSAAAAIQQCYTGHDRVIYATTLTWLGEVQEKASDPSGAIRSLERSGSLLDSLGLGTSESGGMCHYFQAVCYKDLGDLEPALAHAKRASVIFRGIRGGENVRYASSLGQIADILTAKGDVQSALEFYREAVEVSSNVAGKESPYTLEIERKAAHLDAVRGELDAALGVQLDVLRAYRKIYGPDNPELAFLCEEIGDTYRAKGENPRALAFYEQELRIRDSVQGKGARLDIAAPLMEMGRAEIALGNARAAAPLLERSLGIQDSSSFVNRRLKSTTLELLAGLARRHQTGRALEFYDRGLSVLAGRDRRPGAPGPEGVSISPVTAQDPPMPFAGDFVRLLDARAHALLDSARGRPGPLALERAALEDFTRAAGLIGRLRASYRSTGSKLVLQKSALGVYQSGLELASTLYEKTAEAEYGAAAFGFAEEGKAAVLLEGLRNARERKSAGAPEGLPGEERRARSALASLEAGCEWAEDHGDSALSASLRKSLVGKYEELERLEDTLARAGFASFERSDPPCTPADIQRTLPSGTALVEYSLARGRIVEFVLRNDGFDMVSVQPPVSVDSLSGEYRTALRTMDDVALARTAEALGRLLVAPIRKYVRGARRLVIVPDGSLVYVPFEPLLGGGVTVPAGGGQPPYLIGSHEISYALSGSVFLQTRGRETGPSLGAMSFAGFAPVFRDAPARGGAPRRDHSGTADFVASRSAMIEGRKYGELPWSEVEVRAIAESFARGGLPVWCAVNDSASEGNFKANAGRFAILHIASHTRIDEDRPDLSAIMFSPGRDTVSREDGILYSGEVADLRLAADLVVLSSCESGMGRLVKGEGLMALTRGFLLAGAKNLVYSLWKVDDRSTSFLMQRFYAHVLGGESYAAALRSAKLELLHTPGYASPLKWAGFVLMGE